MRLSRVARGLAGAGHVALRGAGLMTGLCAVTVAVIGFRLDGRPLTVTWLVRDIGRIDGNSLSVGSAALAWERAAPGAPLVLTLGDAVLRRADGSVMAAAGHAAIGISPIDLVLGRGRPVFLSLGRASLALRRTAAGFALDTGRATPTGGGSGPGGGSGVMPPDRFYLRDVAVTVTDAALATRWRARIKAAGDGVNSAHPQGTARIDLTDGATTTRLSGRLGFDGTHHLLTLAWTAFRPAGLTLPLPLPLAALDFPVAGQARLRFGPAWRLSDVRSDVQIGAGAAHVGGTSLALAGGTLTLAAVPAAHNVQLVHGQVVLACADGLRAPALDLHGAATRQGSRGMAELALDMGAMDLKTLSACWPVGPGRDARQWVLANVKTGALSAAHLSAGFELGPDQVTLAQLGGTLALTDLSLRWLPTVPPILAPRATLTLDSPDAMTVSLDKASQAPSDPTLPGLALTQARLRISGLSGAVQSGEITADVSGSLAQAIALLAEPRLHLLASHKLPILGATGQMATRLAVTLPLDARVTIDQVAIKARSQLSAVRIPGLVMGRDLAGGDFALTAGNQGLTLSGPCRLAGLPSTLDVTADFRARPAGGAVAVIHAKGTGSAAQLEAAAVPGAARISGGIAYDATLTENQDGSGSVGAALDLAPAGLAIAPLGWAKPVGSPGMARFTLALANGRPTALTALDVRGGDFGLTGRATFAQNQPAVVTISRLWLGRTEASGTIAIPADASQPLNIDLTGPVLDVAAALARGPKHQTPTRAEARAATAARHAAALHAKPRPGRAWTARLAFDQVMMAHKLRLTHASAMLVNDGGRFARADIRGTAGAGPFQLEVSAGRGGRHLTGTAQDAGTLLHALDISGAIRGGTMIVDARYEKARPDQTLAGRAELQDFRVIGAPAMARLLQGMTLYGLVDVLRGPGLAISRLVAPFRYQDTVLTLRRARAYSSSLGFTAEGDIDLVADRADLKGTIVPGYFFNSLPGRVPLIGKLFSLEKGGGLFAADYTLSGPLSDPTVHINPLSALTPGFLRGIFGGQAIVK